MARKFDIECFNSTLVQLKAHLCGFNFGGGKVSILP